MRQSLLLTSLTLSVFSLSAAAQTPAAPKPAAAATKPKTLLATPDTIAWGNYDYHATPVMTVHTGDTVVMQTFSTCGPRARLKSEGIADKDIPSWIDNVYDNFPKEKRGPGGHLLTGPVAIEEAQPGDILEVRILKINLDTNWACNGFGKGHSFLSQDYDYSHSKIIPLDRTKMVADFAPNIHIPLHPFFGSIGVAPPESAGKWNSAPPWIHGGNMDNKELVAGSTVFYPVWAPGALFEAGDGHAGQGNGEVDITALETFLTGTFQFIVHKGAATAQHDEWPRAETKTHYIAMGFDADLTKATQIAVRQMISFLSDPAKAPEHPAFAPLSKDDAYALISTACDVDITELVDNNMGVHVMCAKSLFSKPTATAAKK